MAAAWACSLAQEDQGSRDNGGRVGRLDAKDIVDLGQGGIELPLLAVVIGASDALLSGGRLLGIIEDRGDLAAASVHCPLLT